MRGALVLGVLVLSGAAGAQPARQVVFDFEGGVPGWWGNSWGGGECQVAPATDAKFGRGALKCVYRNVRDGANAVSPYLDEQAAWRKQPWGGLSLWLKGDGSPARASISLETSQESSTGFVVNPPLEDQTWHRLDLPWGVFWSREGLTCDPSQLKRAIIGCTGTHEFLVDQIALEAPSSAVPADRDPSVTAGPLNGALTAPLWKALTAGGFEARLDLSPLRDKGALTVTASVEPPGGKAVEARRKLAPEEAAADEVSLAVAPVLAREGQARAQIRIAGANGAVLAAWGCTFPVVLLAPEPTRPPVAIYPVPKELRRTDGRLRFGRRILAAAVGLQELDLGRTLGMFRREMAAYYGTEVKVTEGTTAGAQVVAVAGADKKLPPALLPPALQKRLAGLGEEGYVLRVTPERAVVAAPTPRGVYYGLQSLLAAIDDETRVPAEAAAPCCEVVDTPSLPFRGVTVGNPTARWGHPNDGWVDVKTFDDFVYRCIARLKLNKIVFIIGEGMQFDSHPELRAPHAWSKEELRTFLQFARDNYVEVIPLVTVLGHANWFALAHPELREPGHDENIACVRKPETNRLIMDVISEVIDVFQPQTFHLGMDECWWRTLSLPPKQRCPLCTGHWADIVAEQATFFHEALAKRGVRTMMWGDMLLAEHNGGPPYHTDAALPRIPKDMTIGDWSWSLAPDSAKRFHDAGLAGVVRSNSLGAPRGASPYLMGNMQGLWSKTPWLTDSYFREAPDFSYLTLPEAAEFSWNLDPRPGGRGFSLPMLEERAGSVLRRIGLQPSPRESGAQTPLDLGLPGPLQELTAGRVTFRVPAPEAGGRPPGIALTKEKPEATVPLDRPTAAVYVLVACDLPAASREAFNKRFQPQEAILGVKIGAVSFIFDDGRTEELPLRYGYNVIAWDAKQVAPYLYGSIGTVTLSPSGHAFAVQWVSAQPTRRVKAIRFTRTDTEATPVVVAATATQPRP